MLHDSSKDEGRNEGNTQRVGHRLVMLFEGVFVDVQAQFLVEVLEEDAAPIVALADDDGILLRELLQIGKRGSKHRVCRDVAHASLFVKVFQIGFHAGYIADDALFGQIGYHLVEHWNGVFQRDGIDQQFWLESLYFLVGCKPLAVVGEAHALGIAFEHSHLVVEAQQVDKETSPLTCSHD